MNLQPSKKQDMVALIETISELHGECRQSAEIAQGDKIVAVSLAFPGPVKDNILLSAPPLNFQHAFDVATVLRQKVGLPVFLENDVNAALLAEAKHGAGLKRNSFLLLSISTGIGSGIWLDGKPLLGTSGEFGHNVLERDAKKANDCGCGNRGCWVAQASGYGIEQSGKKWFSQSRSSEEWFSAAKRKDDNARKLIASARDYTAQGIGCMVNAIEVQEIVVMGSVGLNQFDSIIPSREEIKRYCVNIVPNIVPTALGAGIGLLGAHEAALNKLKKRGF